MSYSRYPRVALGLALAAALAPAAVRANPTSQDPAAVPKGEYELDKRHASLVVKIPHMGGFSKFTLRFDKLDGTFSYDPASWADTKLVFHVDPNSVDTGLKDFDKIIAETYLDSPRFPTITFVTTKVEGSGGRGVVHGDLTFHGVTKPVALETSFNGVGPGLMGAGTRLGFSGAAHIKRSDFGATAASAYAGDDLDLIFDVEFTKK